MPELRQRQHQDMEQAYLSQVPGRDGGYRRQGVLDVVCRQKKQATPNRSRLLLGFRGLLEIQALLDSFNLLLSILEATLIVVGTLETGILDLSVELDLRLCA